MGKRISILIGIVVLAAAFCQLLLPGIIGGNLANRIKEAARAENVTANVRAMPGFMLLAGQMDNLDVVVDNAWLGDIQVSRLTLHGENLQVDYSALDSRDGSAIQSADNLELTGVITQQALQDMLVKKMEKVDNLHVQMDTDKISATGQVKLLGRMADITLEGKVLPENGGLYFHMTRLDIRNAVLGQAVLGNFFGDILIFDLYNSPIRAEIDDVQQQAGQVTIKAVRKEGNSLQ
ncbi:MAG: LmeA family phospholipid-binding protein [Veillonellaceae bacterium]|nr:LmeA family phospholipid-binding protein [Veillonellaceae bacterium]MCI7266786.1 LmeA family phospholipid-binding protein [Veillonellaceae bacterium]MDD6563307.1 LmeA family phospholipid-binding protein [Veillonellaceae bacterium]MDD7655917.1 LmeA family phospholipid-binding protein [Veillonellaceae bacterium]MEE0457735.1 LmeA family phospholipid-binding protein [Anaerovibrio sp.]